MMRCSVLRSNTGFSFIDTLIALSVMSAIMLISIPSISEISSSRAAKRSAEKIAQFINKSSISADAGEIKITINNNQLLAEVNAAQRKLNLSDQVSVRFGSESQDSIKLYSSQIARPGTIIITDRGGSICAVIVSLRARTRILC